MKIKKPCWILSTPRTGSTYLADLLNSTLLFGNEGTITKNTGHIDRWTEYYCDRFFNSSLLTNLPKINKLQYYQYCQYFLNKINIESFLPEIKYILLRRKNTIETAVSYYFVSESYKEFNEFKWNVYNLEEYDKFKNIKINLNINLVSKYYKQACEEYKCWNEFLLNRQFLEIDYDDLVANPQKNVNLVLEYMGLENAPINLDWQYMPKKQINEQKNDTIEFLKKFLNTTISL